jgi:hypothetical protein
MPVHEACNAMEPCWFIARRHQFLPDDQTSGKMGGNPWLSLEIVGRDYHGPGRDWFEDTWI